MHTTPEPFKVVGAEGCELVLDDGRRLIDGVASWWSVCHGYGHPHLVEAIAKQAETLSHVMMGGLKHEPAEKLAARLAAMLPGDFNHVFFSDSGSTAVEVAMKMALQYWSNRGKSGKSRFVCFSDGYHGDTFGAMSISDPERSMHQAFKRNVAAQFVVDIPTDEYSLAEFEETLAGVKDEVAGMIIEPLVQGAGGLKFHSPDMLAALRKFADEHEMLFIADEIATGFARTGSMFAVEEAGIVPDIICLGKALTGGMVGLGATVAAAHVYDAFLDDDMSKALMHGPTFMGNALASAAANASLDLFESEPRLAEVDAIEQQLTKGLAACRELDAVKDVRVKGAIGVVELHPEYADPIAVRLKAAEQGCWIRPFGHVVYLWPPLVISADQLAKLMQVTESLISELAPNPDANQQPD